MSEYMCTYMMCPFVFILCISSCVFMCMYCSSNAIETGLSRNSTYIQYVWIHAYTYYVLLCICFMYFFMCIYVYVLQLECDRSRASRNDTCPAVSVNLCALCEWDLVCVYVSIQYIYSDLNMYYVLICIHLAYFFFVYLYIYIAA